jgi:hypothetical protein
MPRIITVLSAEVAHERQADLKTAYRTAVEGDRPSGLLRTVLLQDANDGVQWRIETLWESREALAAMRGTGTPQGILIFRAAGAEPTLALFEVVDELERE